MIERDGNIVEELANRRLLADLVFTLTKKDYRHEPSYQDRLVALHELILLGDSVPDHVLAGLSQNAVFDDIRAEIRKIIAQRQEANQPEETCDGSEGLVPEAVAVAV